MTYIPVRISKNRAKLLRPAHAPYLHPCRQQRVYRPQAEPEGQRMFGIYAALSPIYVE